MPARFGGPIWSFPKGSLPVYNKGMNLLTDPSIPAPQRPGLLDIADQDLVAWLAERGEKPMRARQLRRWLLVAGAESFDAMTDVPKRLRQELAEEFVPLSTEVVKHLQASDGTHKLLLRLRDGKSDRMRPHPGRQAPHRLHQHASRLRHGLRFLRQRPQWRGPQPDGRRNARATGTPAQFAPAYGEPNPHGEPRAVRPRD